MNNTIITLKVLNRKLIKQTFNPHGCGLVVIPLYSSVQTLNAGQKEALRVLPNDKPIITAQDIINGVLI